MTGEDGIRIKWAEYVDLMRPPTEELIHFHVTLPRDWASVGSFESLEVRFEMRLSDTISSLLETTFSQFEKQFPSLVGKVFDETHDRYSFKVTYQHIRIRETFDEQ